MYCLWCVELRVVKHHFIDVEAGDVDCILNSVGFTTGCLQTIVNGDPIFESLDRHVRCSSFDNSTTSSTH